jgi:undecaprenyl-diphosphatase
MDFLTRLDATVVALAADLARRSEAIDRLVMQIHGLDLFKGGVLLALIVWIWFAAENRPVLRVAMLKTIAAGLLTAIVSRGIQNVLPPRPRPMNAGGAFVPPYGLTPEAIANMASWSSFPSDHAALFFALAVGIWMVHRGLGAFALAWSAIVICLPRIYLGLHYASDVLGGALIGIVAAVVMYRLPGRLFAPVVRIEERWPGPFYAVAFILSFELARLFWDARSAMTGLIASARLIASQ